MLGFKGTEEQKATEKQPEKKEPEKDEYTPKKPTEQEELDFMRLSNKKQNNNPMPLIPIDEKDKTPES